MTKQILQIEGMQADELTNRLSSLENALKDLAQVINPSEKPQEAEYITRRAVCDMLKITLVTVHDWTKKGILTAYKIGNRVYYKPCEVRAAMVQKGGKYA